MIDLSAETPLPLAAAAKLIPPGRSGKHTHLSTLLRWILQGVKSPSGEIVRLEAARLGSRWVTSREALQRFSERLTPRSDEPASPPPRTPGKRQRASEKADAELEKLGC
jgi:uncharacterized protein DUF1580